MSTEFQLRHKFRFPNQWAVNSFLRRLKAVHEWEYVASLDGRFVKVKPHRDSDYILIGLIKEGNAVIVDMNGEKAGGGDEFWRRIFAFANLYRC
jgi:hypothetical protein